MEPFFKIKTVKGLKEVISINNFNSHKKVTESCFGIKNLNTLMVSFFSIRNLMSRKKVMGFFFSINNFKSCKKVMESFF